MDSELIQDALVMKLNKDIALKKGQCGIMRVSYEVSKECDMLITVINRKLGKLEQHLRSWPDSLCIYPCP